MENLVSLNLDNCKGKDELTTCFHSQGIDYDHVSLSKHQTVWHQGQKWHKFTVVDAPKWI